MRKSLSLIALCASTMQAQSFVKDIAPIFEKSCASCHAAQVKMGGLDLGTWEGHPDRRRRWNGDHAG